MNQNCASFEMQAKSYEDDQFRTKTDIYIDLLTNQTRNGRLSWHRGRAPIAEAFELSCGRIIIQVIREDANPGYECYKLYMRKAGDFYTPPVMVAQHVSSIGAQDELRDLWTAIQEYIEVEHDNFPFKHMDEYIAKSQRDALNDMISSIINDACRDIIKLVQEQKIEK